VSAIRKDDFYNPCQAISNDRSEYEVTSVGSRSSQRCGIIVNVTPFEPEWEGHVTLEISNTTPLPAKIYANEGLTQVLFLRASEICETFYADRKGKYQNQRGITLPRR
jgi:dCTP deaminase